MKNFSKYLSLLFLTCNIFAVSAQTTSYTVIYDDPTKFKNLFVNFHFFDVDFATPSSLRVGLGAEYTLNKRLSFSVDFDRAIMDAFPVEDAVKTKGNLMEAGTVFSFYNHVRNGNIKFHWKEGGTIFGGGDSYKMKVPGKALKQIGLKAGLHSFSSPKEIDNYNVFYNTIGLYAGLCVVTTKNMSINADGIAMRHTNKESRSNFYIDALFTPVISVKDNTDYNSVVIKALDVNNNPDLDTLVTKKPFGARIGYMKYKRYPIPLKMGGEIGLRPGIQSNFYFLAKFAVSIGFNVANKNKS